MPSKFELLAVIKRCNFVTENFQKSTDNLKLKE